MTFWRGGRWPTQGTSWPMVMSMWGEPLDALEGDLAAGVGGELDVVERDAHECARRVGGRERGDVEEGGRPRWAWAGSGGHGAPFGSGSCAGPRRPRSRVAHEGAPAPRVSGADGAVLAWV